ncbi:helix-turn-helix domain-containing protein [Mycolicibacterium mageritense DSM 44476 = CIP 104973]|jgi:transcriptional regulator with XRE-family HTH domain|nr:MULTISPECIES: XRE family transcriptional regulator [Mycolicibacterium]MCC9186918.1 XRE family transcriptional regulator [Mycolicibacterium mageritense]MCV7210603.1 ImmA/IrrE family metallo-endopeptidase [Mycolicibacterium canariasense]ORV18635.1 hypothetical protein AWB94_33510 [Mycolicibacterium canariasense]CDO25787.1 transcriptional regulator [Mycolicibacterium mageritense DSM 44476 = CIP 104973]BBX37547.1 hypothetical protein MMAGJ_68290 [Mycolicibacterium mageritense]
MDGKILGERIVEARKARDLTQEHLAATIGIDRSALGLIEKGKRKVSAIELVDLAAALSTPLAWFVRDPLAAVISRRAEAGPSHEVTARLDQALELFAGDVAELLADGVIRPLPDRPAWRTPQSVASAEMVARQVREHLGLGHEPLGDVAAVAERFGLYSCALRFGEQGADGALVAVADGAAVAVIDGDARVGRRRMSLAHELGHWLFGDAFDSNTGTDTEQLITSFAAFFLAPRAGVTALWNQYRSERLRDTVVRVAGIYRLSWSAAVLHLHTLHLITDEQRRVLEPTRPAIGEFTKLQIILDTDELRPPSVSPGLAAAVLDAYVDLRISAPRAVELLRGQLDIADLPQPRAEIAADYARMG